MSVSQLESSPSYVSPYLRDPAKPSDGQNGSVRQQQADQTKAVPVVKSADDQPKIGFAIAGSRPGSSLNIVV